MGQPRLLTVTVGLLLSLALGALEATVVSTALPTIVAHLGGLELYGWVFAIYSLGFTVTLPIFGRLSDRLGRKPVFLGGIALFVAGSVLCGQAGSMNQLVAFRAIQGIGAGAVTPIAFTIVAEIYPFEQRARMQGIFSSVWGIASVIGPPVGGFLVDRISWRWVFYLNLPFGLLAAVLIAAVLREPVTARQQGRVDYLGAGLLIAGVLSLLLALMEGGRSAGGFVLLLAVAAAALLAFVYVERRAAEPIVPLGLFRDRLYVAASGQGFVAGLAIFATMAYIPLFVQEGMRTSATVAGATLTPMILGWVSGNFLSGQLLSRVDPRRIAVGGMSAMVVGALLLNGVGAESGQALLLVSMFLMGGGMGTTLTTYIVVIQGHVTHSRLGIATSGLQFMRQMGGTIGVSLVGAVMLMRLSAGLATIPAGRELDPRLLLDRAGTARLPAEVAESLPELLSGALRPGFLIVLVGSLLALGCALLTPPGSTRQLVEHDAAVDQAETERRL